MTGRVKHWNDRGFGFISDCEGTIDEIESLPVGRDVFVHARDLPGTGRRDLRKGQEVEFDVVVEERGAKAVNVVLM